MRFTPHSQAELNTMLQDMGLNSIDELFSDIPDTLKLKEALNLGQGMSEMSLRRHMTALSRKNIHSGQYPCFLGAGAYDHYIPAAMEELLSRSEFYTTYTPYQAEISQGILQSIFEYQTMICELTGMEVSNASLYDGATALAEACKMACEATRRSQIILPATLHPSYQEVVESYAISGKMEIIMAPEHDGLLDLEQTLPLINKQTAAVIIQQPNFYGLIEELEALEKAVHAVKGMLIMAVNPISLAMLRSPGEWGADIAVGEGQPLGNPLNFGGPYLGFMACTKKNIRRLPGRIVGQSVDTNGKRAFVLTLQAREQHIRRERANSNICSNQALNALAASMYLSLVGKQGLRDIALRCHRLACYARDAFSHQGIELKYEQPFFMEFAVKVADPQKTNRKLLEEGIIGGYELEDALLFAFTEKRSRPEIDQLVASVGRINNE